MKLLLITLISLFSFSMVLGGVPIVGLFSLMNYFTFLPPGGSCGVVFSLSPLEVRKLRYCLLDTYIHVNAY